MLCIDFNSKGCLRSAALGYLLQSPLSHKWVFFGGKKGGFFSPLCNFAAFPYSASWHNEMNSKAQAGSEERHIQRWILCPVLGSVFEICPCFRSNSRKSWIGLCLAQCGLIVNVFWLHVIFQKVIPSFLYRIPWEYFPKSCPGVLKVIMGGAPPWNSAESGVCWDWGVYRKHPGISTRCVCSSLPGKVKFLQFNTETLVTYGIVFCGCLLAW